MSYIEYTVRIRDNGDRDWRLNGKLHRADGPAVEYSNGDKEWFLNDLRHREDGPAFEGVGGHKGWWRNGKLHREDGPAVECSNGHKEYFLNGEQLSEEEFNCRIKTNNSCDGKIVEIDGKKYKLSII